MDDMENCEEVCGTVKQLIDETKKYKELVVSSKDMLEEVQVVYGPSFSNIQQRHLQIRIKEFNKDNKELKFEEIFKQLKDELKVKCEQSTQIEIEVCFWRERIDFLLKNKQYTTDFFLVKKDDWRLKKIEQVLKNKQ